jgi:hypothetical protein
MSKIGLYDCGEGVVNSALMQISSYHKSQGDTVEWYRSLFSESYDKVYCSSLFKFSDKSYVTPSMICGGTGFQDISVKLPPEIECCGFDYSIYPGCDFSLLWFSKGCIRNCPFCLVREKEGYIHSLPVQNLNPKGKTVRVMDNNFFANPSWPSAVEYLKSLKLPVSFQGGVDLRILTEDHCKALVELNLVKDSGVYVAWDNPKEDLRSALNFIVEFFPKRAIVCYVLIGYWSTQEEDLYRVSFLKSIGVRPFVMPYNKEDLYQRSFARYVNFRAAFMSCTWEEYKSRKSLNF